MTQPFHAPTRLQIGLFCAAFFVLYHAVSQQATPQLGHTEARLDHLHRRLQQQATAADNAGTTAQSSHRAGAPIQGKRGDPSLTPSQKALRIGFYLWLSLLNLVATSTLWARAADAFDSNAASRLFGFLGAGATLGANPPPPHLPRVPLLSLPQGSAAVVHEQWLCCAYSLACVAGRVDHPCKRMVLVMIHVSTHHDK